MSRQLFAQGRGKVNALVLSAISAAQKKERYVSPAYRRSETLQREKLSLVTADFKPRLGSEGCLLCETLSNTSVSRNAKRAAPARQGACRFDILLHGAARPIEPLEKSAQLRRLLAGILLTVTMIGVQQ